MEKRGVVRKEIAPELKELAAALCETSALLLAGVGGAKVTSSRLADLSLLTLGAQFKGGANVRKGIAGAQTVFNVIHEIVELSVVTLTSRSMEVRSAAGRSVLIEFASDPDMTIREQMQSGAFREVVAIEVKAGADASNIHNRIGEAEKSHLKAKGKGYSQFWTVVNVDSIDMAMARRESPSTNRFYRMSDLVTAESEAYRDFRDRIISLTSIAP